MLKPRLFVYIVLTFILSSCGALDRDKGDLGELDQLEPIPEEQVSQEPSLFIGDEEMMPSETGVYEDTAAMAREEQISAEPSGTFVGQKIPALSEDYGAVKDAFEIHRNTYEEVKSRVYGASTQFYGTVAAINTKLQLGTTPGNPILVKQYDQAQTELKNIESLKAFFPI